MREVAGPAIEHLDLDEPLGKHLLALEERDSFTYTRFQPLMRQIKPNVVIVAIVAALFVSKPGAQGRVENSSAGLSLDPPLGWQMTTAAEVQANRERVRLSDSEFQRALVTRSALPIVALMKYPEPFEGLNPSVQVTLRQALRGTPTDLLSGALATMRRGFADLAIVRPVEATTVSGLPAAHVRVTYTLRTATQVAPVLSRIWLVPRGSLMFLIGMSGAQSGPDLCEAEFAAVIRSLRIAK